MAVARGQHLRRPGFACVVAPYLLLPRLAPTQTASTCPRELQLMAYTGRRGLEEVARTRASDMSVDREPSNPRAMQRKYEAFEHADPITLEIMLFEKSTSRSGPLLRSILWRGDKDQ